MDTVAQSTTRRNSDSQAYREYREKLAANACWERQCKLEQAQAERRRKRFAVGESTGNARLTAKQISKIREKYATGSVPIGELAKDFGVSKGHICNIVHRKVWKHIP